MKLERKDKLPIQERELNIIINLLDNYDIYLRYLIDKHHMQDTYDYAVKNPDLIKTKELPSITQFRLSCNIAKSSLANLLELAHKNPDLFNVIKAPNLEDI